MTEYYERVLGIYRGMKNFLHASTAQMSTTVGIVGAILFGLFTGLALGSLMFGLIEGVVFGIVMGLTFGWRMNATPQLHPVRLRRHRNGKLA